MQPFRSRLEELVRSARARMPARARGIVDRIEGMVQARRSSPPEAPPPPVVEPPPAPPAPKPVNWELRSQAEIVAHIEQHYHAGLRRDLPELVAEARRVGRADVAELLEEFASELEAHMQKEERMLFPVLRTGSRGGPIDMPIRMMEREHDSHDEQLQRLRTLTNDFTAPADAAWASLYARLAALETELRQHIYLENNVLFARATGGEY